MDKAAILIELNKAEKVYLKAIETLPEFICRDDIQNLDRGFCKFFDNFLDCSQLFYDLVLKELSKDFISDGNYYGDYWYRTANYFFIKGDISASKIKELSLKPRLEHLQRTINRLENELKNQPTI